MPQAGIVVIVVVGLFHVYLKHGNFYNDISIEMRVVWVKILQAYSFPLIHQDIESSVIRPLLYLQATMAG